MTYPKINRPEAILVELQGDLPVERRPFGTVAFRVGMTEDAVLDALRQRIKQGVIRRFGAILRHQKAGVTLNAMVIWAVPPERTEEVGTVFASFREITHCYERCPSFQGRYNLFTMLHTGDAGLESIIAEISDRAAVYDYRVLLSEEEFKKSSMEYF
jgi:DNA-binding Lrp family transcriptional regulator